MLTKTTVAGAVCFTASGIVNYNSGFFFEMDAESLEEVFSPASVKCQTVTYFCIEKDEITTALANARPDGVDCVVPIGASTNFTLTWDGYDLIRTLARNIGIS